MFKLYRRFLFVVIPLMTVSSFSQKKSLLDQDYNMFSIGAGFSSLSLHGDMVSLGTNSGTNYFNLGGYLYANVMFNPIVGAEVKFNFNEVKGEPVTGGIDLADIEFTGESEGDFRADGVAIGFETNLVLDFDNMYSRNSKKFNFAGIVGFGMHTYDTALFLMETGEPIKGTQDIGVGSEEAKSIYLNAGLSLKYRVNERFDIESRFNINLNNEDHLDAAITTKQTYETFFTFGIGGVYKLGNKEKHAVWFNEDSRSYRRSGGSSSSYKKRPSAKRLAAEKTPIDSDRDGIIDSLDNCPNQAGSASNKGCPVGDTVIVAADTENSNDDANSSENEVTEVTTESELEALAKQLKFGRSEGHVLKATNELILDRIAMILKENPATSVKFELHTSNKPEESYNLALSIRRANAILKYLTSVALVSANQVEAVGLGATKPKYNMNNKETNDKNNRVELIIN